MHRTVGLCSAAAMLAMAALAGCSGPAPGPVDPSPAILSGPPGGDYVSGKVILRDLGTGPVQRKLTIPGGYDAVMFSVSCVPDADYSVTFGGGFSADCNRTNRGGGTMPREVIGDAAEATLKIPAGTRRWFVAVALKSAG